MVARVHLQVLLEMQVRAQMVLSLFVMQHQQHAHQLFQRLELTPLLDLQQPELVCGHYRKIFQPTNY
jgi:hypothetical protein